VLLATFSIRPLHATTETLIPPFSHFDPFGTEFREPGRISHPTYHIADFQFSIAKLSGAGSNRQSKIGITKILPACAGVPGDLAPVETLQFLC
jgi:hypothetical protein